MKWISGIVFFVTIASYSQETKFVLKHSDDFEEEYYVLATDKKIKHGTYVKYTNGFSGISIIESGSYLNGNKNGQWESYFSAPLGILSKNNPTNSLKERGTFVNGKKNGLWTYFYLDTIPDNITTKPYGGKKRPDSVNVEVKRNDLRPRLAGHFLNDKRVGDWVTFDFAGNVAQRYNFTKQKLLFDASNRDSLNYSSMYLGGVSSLSSFLAYEINLSGLLSLKDSTTVIAQFSVDNSGRISDAKVYKSNGPASMEKEVLRLVALLDGSWIPALQNGQHVPSDYKIAFDYIRWMKTEKTGHFKIRFRPMPEE